MRLPLTYFLRAPEAWMEKLIHAKNIAKRAKAK